MKEQANHLSRGYALIFPVLLFLYPLRHIWLGVELTDSAYSAGNYRFLDQMNPMWLFSTYLANKTGAFLTNMPFGNILIGLNAYTALCISITALIVYFSLTNIVKMRKGIVFLAEIVAISLCWCPTTILYNYMTYLFFQGAVILLYIGLVKEKRIFLFGAGVLLGWNVLVRFPNIMEIILIVVVWYYAWLVQKRLKDVIQETAISILGFFCGAGLILFQIAIQYGLETYINAIAELLQMPSDASDYSLYSMILTPILDYKASARWLLSMILMCVVMSLLFRILQGKFEILKKILCIMAIIALFGWWYKLGVFNVKYYTYESMFQWVAVFLMLSIIICVHDLTSSAMNRKQKIMALCVLIVVAVTPIGSNNHLYPNINNMFLILPFSFTRIYQAFTGRMQGDYFESGWLADSNCKIGRITFSSFPVKAMLCLFIAVFCIQCMGFGIVFTFRDGMSGQKRDTKVENNAILNGMVTNKELAEELDGLTTFVEQEGLQNKKVILYGQIPGIAYYLDMQPALSTSWPDLRSYSLDVFEEDLQKISDGLDVTSSDTDRPVIIVSAKIDAYLTDDAEGMGITGVTQSDLEGYLADQKLQDLGQFIQKYNYTEVYTNTGFAVFE